MNKHLRPCSMHSFKIESMNKQVGEYISFVCLSLTNSIDQNRITFQQRVLCRINDECTKFVVTLAQNVVHIRVVKLPTIFDSKYVCHCQNTLRDKEPHFILWKCTEPGNRSKVNLANHDAFLILLKSLIR